MAEGRGKAQADTLRRARSETMANRIVGNNGQRSKCRVLNCAPVTWCSCRQGEFIPSDGEIIEGVASVDESAITGESAPVIREAGGDRSAVTGGTRVLSDQIKVKITSNPGETFLDRMIALVEGAERQKTPNEIALNILLAGLTIIFLLAVVTLQPFAIYSGSPQTVFVLVSLLVCLIPTTIGGLLSAIGIAGMDRLVQHNVLAMSGRAVEAAGDVNTLLLDKTGTITLGNRQAARFIPAPGVTEQELADAAQLSSLADETPEGRSIVVLAKEKYGLRGRELGSHDAHFVPFTAQTRMSGVDLNGFEIRKGAADAVAKLFSSERTARCRAEVKTTVEEIARSGGTPLVVAEKSRGALGVIELKDVVKGGMRERFDQLRAMGIKTVMITGDNPLTAAAIAREAGVDDFLAQATPKDKMDLIKKEQADGKLVAMTGDGTNDAPALAQADVGVAMNTGTQAAKEAGNMVDLDSNPTKLIEIVEIGKQLLMTRGSLDHLLDRQRRRQIFRDHSRNVRRALPGFERAEHHAPANAAIGDSVRGDLQCTDHHCPDPAGIARREVSADGRRGTAAQQSVDLWRRWNHCAVHRDQADRHDDHPRGACIEGNGHEEKSYYLGADDNRDHRFARDHLSVGGNWNRTGSVSREGEWTTDSEQRQDRWFRDHRAGLLRPRLFSLPAVDSGKRLRRRKFNGSQLGPTNQKLIDRVKGDVATAQAENPGTPVPIDLVTASASGFDPHITPAAAEFQLSRVAKERGTTVDRVRASVSQTHRRKTARDSGEPRVNVLELNLELDEQFPTKKQAKLD